MTDAVLAAVNGLRSETRDGFAGVGKRLDMLNGKVAEHEGRFQRQDGAEAERAKAERARILELEKQLAEAKEKVAAEKKPKRGLVGLYLNNTEIILFAGVFGCFSSLAIPYLIINHRAAVAEFVGLVLKRMTNLP